MAVQRSLFLTRRNTVLYFFASLFFAALTAFVLVVRLVAGLTIEDVLRRFPELFLFFNVALITAIAGFFAYRYRNKGPYYESEIEKEAEKEIIKDSVSGLADVFHVLRLRLLLEAERLKFTSNKNLTIGILFSVCAFGILAYFIFAYQASMDSTKDYLEFLSRWFAPRLSVVILIQVVGFFFLRLYVANELDIKHNKNELTNIEAKLMAYAMAKASGKDQIKIVVDELARTERNFLIKKGERTTANENLSEYNDLKDLCTKLVDKIPGKNK